MQRLLHAFTAAVLLLATSISHADLTVEIVGGAAQQIPIAVVPFGQDNIKIDNPADIIAADLRRSGLFRTLETRGMASQPHDLSQVRYAEWAALQAQAMVIGKVEARPGGRLNVSFRLLDVVKQVSMVWLEYDITPNQMRNTAHKIADVIYEKLTGERGVFATRITYVTKMKDRFILQVADSDGANPQTVLSSREPIISPSWSPDGNSLAYVSFEKKKPIIYVQSLTSGQRYVLANFKGNNSAPAWSPDGKRLAIVLTYGDNSQIYAINANGTGLKRLSYSRGIDTEPTWSPDGQWIYFTSDRGGSPQIYRMSALGGDAQRVSFEGSYNVSPHLSPDGKLLTYIRRQDGRFRVTQQEIATGQSQILSDYAEDESPSFAPNGRLILFATNMGRKGVLSVVSADGRTKQRLSDSGGDVREPSWGPWIN